MNRLIAIAALIFISAGIASAKDLKTYKATYEKQMEEIILSHGMKMTDLNKQYTKALDLLLAKVKKTGDLDKTKAVMSEIERFGKEQAMPTKSPPLPDLQNLQTSYVKRASSDEAYKARKVITLTSKYDRTLEQLQKSFVMSDKLDEAETVQEERKRAKTCDAYTASVELFKQRALSTKKTPDGPKNIMPTKESTVIGTINGTVRSIGPTGHKIQVWQVLPEHLVLGKYTLEMQHAAKGSSGAFCLTAWIDSNGDNLPDKELSRSKQMLAKDAGDWSEWMFSVRKMPDALYVGSCWEDSATVIYYQSAVPDGYIGLKHAVRYSRNSKGTPTSTAKPRYTNIKLTVPSSK